MKNFGRYLKAQRESVGLTQAQVAQSLGYGSPQFISNIERGVSKVPASGLKELVDLLKCDHAEVIEMLLQEKRIHIQNILKNGAENDPSVL